MSMGSLPCAVTGWGAVSPAGWSAAALHDAVGSRAELPVKRESRCEGAPPRRFRPVPPHPAPPEWMKQPRLRRTTSIARYAVHAACEALGDARLALRRQGALRVGVVFCSMNGGVQFSRRFYAEVLANPSLASPILFPETVYNAPASHIAAVLGSPGINYTLVGDTAQFIAGLDLGAQWLAEGLADSCVVVAAEELDWLTDEALLLFCRKRVAAEGAAAVLLEPRSEGNAAAPFLKRVTPSWTYGAAVSRASAAQSMWRDLISDVADTALLCDGLGGGARANRAERAASASWKGPRVSVLPVLGESFAVTSGWQSVAALECLRSGAASQALVPAVGSGQQAVGAVFAR
jgi:hypothetical protein